MYHAHNPDNIHKAAVLYTMTLARDLIERRNSEGLREVAQVIVSYMVEKSIEITLMKHLSVTVETILTFDKDYGIRRDFHARLVESLTEAMNQPDSNVKFEFLGLCAQISMGSTLHITK